MKKNGNSTKKDNYLLILKAFRNKSTLTKPNLADLTGLSNVTVNNAINDLIKTSIVIDQGIAESSGGRKAALFSLNGGLFKIVGVVLSLDKIIVSLFDLNINILASTTLDIDVDSLLIEESVNHISDMVHRLLTEEDINKEQLLGVGVSVPGTVECNKSVVNNVPRLKKWKNIPLKDMLEDKLSVQVYVENDVNGGLLALKWKDMISEDKSCVYLSLKGGVGARILLDGKIFRGNEGISGEIGHISVEQNGPHCKCGNRGCLELYISDGAILKNAVEMAQEKKGGILYEICESNPETIDFNTIIEAGKEGDEAVVGIFQEASRYMTLCIDMILKIIAPMELIIESEWLSHFDNYYYSILNTTYKNSSFFSRSDVRISLNTTKNIFLLGSATIVLDEIMTKADDNALLDMIEQLI